MKALDAHLEKITSDGIIDRSAKFRMSREAESSEYRLGLDPHYKKVLITSNYFALASPIMPFGLLGMLFLLDRLSSLYDQSQTPDKDTLQNTQNAQAVYLAAMNEKAMRESKKEIDSLPPPEVLPLCTRQTRKTIKDTGKKQSRVADSVSALRQPKPVNKLFQPWSPRLNITKLLIEKTALQGYLEKLGRQQDYHGFCRISARIGLLDKALQSGL